MRNLASWAKRGLIALAPLPLVFAIGATAADNTSNVSPTLRAAMQRDLGLTSAQLAQYLKIERLAALHESRLAAAQGRNFAGSWIERGADGSHKLVVATTRPGQRSSIDGVEFRAARHSLADLNASKGQLDAMLRTSRPPQGVYSWYVDPRSNSVVVGIGRGQQQAGVNFVAASGAESRHVRFVVEEQASLRADIRGGHGYLRNPGDGYLYACSVGFAVNGGFVTAGHCGNRLETAYLEGNAGTGPQWTLGPAIGTFQASDFPNPGQSGNDMAWVAVSGHNTIGYVYGWNKTADVRVAGGTAAGNGAAICRSGRTSGWRCGNIDAVNVSVTYSTGETITNMTRTTACSEGGDSGGSFITGPGQAQGVLSGGSGSCKGKQPNNRTRSYFQPLQPILQRYNLTLKIG